jgi:hypothetical protein
MNTPHQQARSADVTALTCDSCGTAFSLLEDGGKIERALDSTDGTLYNLETFCVKCNAGNTEYRIRVQAAELLLSGTGLSLGETEPANA